MIIGPKYKIARRLNAPVFEKTQTQKYALSSARKTKKVSRGPRQKSAYGEQMNEKQKARFTYLLTEKQFSNYVRSAISATGTTISTLFGLLEGRLDSVVYRVGMATTRSGARQMVSHGHITVNGRRVDIPSYQISEGDTVAIRAGSIKKPLFTNVSDRMKAVTPPSWVRVDTEKVEAVVSALPTIANKTESLFDLNLVVEFYSR